MWRARDAMGKGKRRSCFRKYDEFRRAFPVVCGGRYLPKKKVNIVNNVPKVPRFMLSWDLRALGTFGTNVPSFVLKNSERVEYFRNEYERQIGLKKDEGAECEARKRASEQHIKNIQNKDG